MRINQTVLNIIIYLFHAARKSHPNPSAASKARCYSRRYLHRLLLLLLGLEILIGEVGGGTTNEHDGVHTDAEASGITGRCCGGDSAGLGCLRGWVAGLFVVVTIISHQHSRRAIG